VGEGEAPKKRLPVGVGSWKHTPVAGRDESGSGLRAEPFIEQHGRARATPIRRRFVAMARVYEHGLWW
jgi:hypothetical protein